MSKFNTNRPGPRNQLSLLALAFAAIVIIGVIGVAVFMLTGCTKSAQQQAASETLPAATFPVEVTDDASRTVTIKAAPKRIVSLAPANTEMLFAMGLGDRVVGVTSYDDYPAEVAKLAKVGDFTGPNLEAVAAAKPDLIVATTGVQADVIGKLEQLGATVIAFDPQSLEGLYEDISELGAATGKVEQADKLIADMESKVEEITVAVASSEPTTTFIEIGQNPLFTAGTGTLIDEMIALAGGVNVVTQPGYVPYSVEQLVQANPGVYLATKGTMSDPAALGQRPGYADLAAVKANRVIVLDDNLVTRPGPRIVDGLRQIAEGLHPEAFQ